jgi:hypothetical protein
MNFSFCIFVEIFLTFLKKIMAYVEYPEDDENP